MRIAIDARMIKPGSMHGIARYVFHLLAHLREIGKNHEIFALVNPDSPLKRLDWPKNMKLVDVACEWISLREHFELPRVLKSVNADLFHATSYVAPMFTPCKLVMTIHDLNHLVLPQFYTPLHQIYYKVVVRSCIERSQFILTVSHFSKDEIVRKLGLKPDKVFVTYNGVSDNYLPVRDQDFLDYVRDVYELPDKFIFCLSNNKPHKNIQQLVRAYCYSDISIPLVLASPVDRNAIRIAENCGKKHLIYFSKFINEEHLPAVYSMTHLFVFPSTYEGFGLPPLEAMACGTPVVVAKSSSLPEVVGDCAIFANPYDYKDISEALKIGCNDLQRRADLTARGIQHAKKYSWNSMAQNTLSTYEKCLQESSEVVYMEAEANANRN